jgi:hypothetical protein
MKISILTITLFSLFNVSCTNEMYDNDRLDDDQINSNQITYPIVDTYTKTFYTASTIIDEPLVGESFF